MLRFTCSFKRLVSTLAVGISYAQIGRYETKNTQPPAEVLKNIADALDTTVDFLISGDTNVKAKTALKDSELLQ